MAGQKPLTPARPCPPFWPVLEALPCGGRGGQNALGLWGWVGPPFRPNAGIKRGGPEGLGQGMAMARRQGRAWGVG